MVAIVNYCQFSTKMRGGTVYVTGIKPLLKKLAKQKNVKKNE